MKPGACLLQIELRELPGAGEMSNALAAPVLTILVTAALFSAELALPNCEVPVTSLPLLRCPMLRLTRLVLDLGGSECEDMNTAALVPLLMLLCKPHAGAAPLLHLEGTGCPGSLDVDQCKRSLEEQLQQCYGVTDVSINLTHG